LLFYPAALPLSRQTLDDTTGIIRRHRRNIGSCWRKLNPARQALLVLAYLRKGETFAELAAGFGIGTGPCDLSPSDRDTWREHGG
jgi:Helix-turn-helix of DDE superfamily endonuclease